MVLALLSQNMYMRKQLNSLKHIVTRSTGTVHTCAKACLTSVIIRIRDPDCHQNLIICSLPTLPENFMQIRKTNRQRTTITYPTWWR